MKKGVIKAGGSVTARFIENGTVFAKEDIVAETLIQPCGKRRTYKAGWKNALIVGGKVHATLGISAYHRFTYGYQNAA